MNQQEIDKLPEIKIDGDWETREVYVNGKFLDPKPSLKIHNHSPDGFNWGYGGSGPAQLALAILLKFMSPEDAQQHYMDFKFSFIAGLPQTDFEVTVKLKDHIKERI